MTGQNTAAAPRVSVIIVFRNEEHLLTEAVESVWAQTFADYEIILADDGSADGSPALAQKLLAHAPDRMRYLHHPGRAWRGISATRNLGLAAARGEFVAFLDADDVWLPRKLAEQVAIMDAEPALGMVYGRSLIWYSWQPGPAATDFQYDMGLPTDQIILPFEPLRIMIDNRSQTPTPSNAMMRLAALSALGGAEPSFRTMFEDVVFFGKMLAAHPVHVSSQTWIKYRQHADSVCASIDPLAETLARVKFLRWLKRYLSQAKVDDPAVSATLRHELRAARRQQLRLWVKRLVRRG